MGTPLNFSHIDVIFTTEITTLKKSYNYDNLISGENESIKFIYSQHTITNFPTC